jgi:hypothetical protein
MERKSQPDARVEIGPTIGLRVSDWLKFDETLWKSAFYGLGFFSQLSARM